MRKSPSNENNLLYTWKQAAERESRQRLRRFLLIAVALLGLLGGIVGEQLGLWSLRAVVDRAVEMVRQRVALLSGSAVAPEAVGGRDQERQEAPLPRRTLPTTTSGNERANAGTAVPPVSAGARAGSRSSCRAAGRSAACGGVGAACGWRKQLAIKKVVVVRSGDTLSKILTQEYGEYTKAVVDLVSEANPGLRNIHFLEVGQRLILPERAE